MNPGPTPTVPIYGRRTEARDGHRSIGEQPGNLSGRGPINAERKSAGPLGSSTRTACLRPPPLPELPEKPSLIPVQPRVRRARRKAKPRDNSAEAPPPRLQTSGRVDPDVRGPTQHAP